MMVTKKKNGTVCICLDSSFLNEKMFKDCRSPPPMGYLLLRCKDVIFLTSLRFRLSHSPVPLHPKSRKYSAFLYNGRSYTFQVLPFMLETTVAIFSRCLNLVLGPEERDFTVNYIDDLLIAFPALFTHLGHINHVLENLS